MKTGIYFTFYRHFGQTKVPISQIEKILRIRKPEVMVITWRKTGDWVPRQRILKVSTVVSPFAWAPSIDASGRYSTLATLLLVSVCLEALESYPYEF